MNIPHKRWKDFKNIIFLSKLCDLKIGSFLYQSDVMTFHLKSLEFTEAEGTDGNLDYEWDYLKLDKNLTLDAQRSYSVVGIHFLLARHYTQQLLSYYCPSLKFVLVSWISFLIPPDAIPGISIYKLCKTEYT